VIYQFSHQRKELDKLFGAQLRNLPAWRRAERDVLQWFDVQLRELLVWSPAEIAAGTVV